MSPSLRPFWSRFGPTRLGTLVVAALLACVAACLPHALYAAPLAPLAAAAFSGVTTDLASMNEAMKVVTSIPLVRQYVSDSEFLSLFRTESNIQTEKTTTGRYIETANMMQLPAGVGARGENDYLPEPTPAKFKNGRIYLKKITGVVEMTGDTMQRVTGDPEAFINWMEEALPDFSERVSHEVDRMSIGFSWGVKARIANLSTTKGGYTFTNGKSAFSGGQFAICIDRSFGVTGYSGASLQFMEGDRIVFTSALSTPVSLRNSGTNQSAVVDQVDDDNDVLVLTADTTLQSAVAASDYIAMGDKATHSFPQDDGTEREFMGLLGHVDDGGIVPTYFNIARSSNPKFRSVLVDASSTNYNGTLSEDLVSYGDDLVATKSGGKIDVIATSRAAVRGYWRTLRGDRFFLDPRNLISQGGKPATVQILLGDRTVSIKVARKIPPEVAFGLDTKGYVRISPNEWTWDDTTGAIWKPVTDATGRKHQFYAFGYSYEQLFNKTPRRNVRFDGLSTQY